MVSGSVTIGIDSVHFKQGRTTAILGMPRKNNATGWRPRGISIVHIVIRQSKILSRAHRVNVDLSVTHSPTVRVNAILDPSGDHEGDRSS